MEIALTQGKFALIDKADFHKISPLAWHAKRGRGDRWVAEHSFYDKQTGRKNILMHRLILCPPDHLVVDHINGDALDNRRENLRVCTHQQNSMNRAGWGRTEYIGVVKVGKLWRARIEPNGHALLLGLFETPGLAAAAYNKAARIIYRDFARINQVPELDPDIWMEMLTQRKRNISRLNKELEILTATVDPIESH